MTNTAIDTFNLDIAHSEIGFNIKHLGLSTVKGAFTAAEASVEMENDDLSTLKATASIDASSINTKNEDRDNHLRSGDFFDVEHYSALTFTSTGISDIKGNSFKLHGDLTIRNITKSIVLDAEFLGTATDPWGGQRIAFEAAGSFNRKDFELTWNQVLEAGGLLVAEDVKLTLDIQAVKA